MKPPRTPVGALLILAAVALGGCAGPGLKPPTLANLTLHATTTVNPDAGGRPSPIVLSVFELRAAGRFNAADFLSLHERADQTLAADLARREEVLLAPGESRTLNLRLQEGSRYLGITGGYRRFGEARWRVLAAIPEGTTSRVVVRADTLSVSIESAGP
jgi:type VI secretion system protein VasD